MHSEAQLGISEFLTPEIAGFRGLLKERFSDFNVFELDKSDQVFHMNTQCNVTNYIDIHTKLFCDTDDMRNETAVCKDPEAWLNSKNNHYQDPHFCQASCDRPGPNCTACTNPSYFICQKSGMCLHPDLVCDGHPQCIEG